jgi:ABC-type phosphate/phosphonate transport system substrate-binding protein
MFATFGGHTETLAQLLANKADVHAANEVVIAIVSFEIHVTFDIAWNDLRNVGFEFGTHRDTRAASGQQS